MRVPFRMALSLPLLLAGPAPAQGPPAIQAAAQPAAQPAAKPAEGGLAAVLAKYPIRLGGFLKLDASWDDSRLNDGNYGRWVEREDTNDDDDQFNITARQSRFWMEVTGPSGDGLKSSAYAEVDFYEGGAENKFRLMMRHGYLKVHWTESDLEILAGQTSDLVSALVIPTINYTVGWWVGNIGYRRPQLRVSKGFQVDDDTRLLAQLAATRTVGELTGGTTAIPAAPFTPGDTGEDAGFPSLQGRLALDAFLLCPKKKATLALFGHYGQEEYDTNAQGDSEEFESWSLGLDIELPLCPMAAFKGSLWTGKNLDDYLGGVAQGINAGTMEEIAGTGGWAAITLTPDGPFSFTGGVGLDDPKNDDLAAGSRNRNIFWFLNGWYAIDPAVKTGLELSYWETGYQGFDDADAIRAQFSMMFTF